MARSRGYVNLEGDNESSSPLLDVAKEGTEALKEISATAHSIYDILEKSGEGNNKDEKESGGGLLDSVKRLTSFFTPNNAANSSGDKSAINLPSPSLPASAPPAASSVPPAAAKAPSGGGGAGGGGGMDLGAMAQTLAKAFLAEGGSTNAKQFVVGELGGQQSSELVLNPTGAPISVLNNEQQKQLGIDIGDLHKGDMSGKAGSGLVATNTENSMGKNRFSEGTGFGANLDLLSDMLKNQKQYAVNISNGFNESSNEVRRFSAGTLDKIAEDVPKYGSGSMTALADNIGGQVLRGNPDPKELISLPADAISGMLSVIPVIGPVLSQVVDVAKDVALAFVSITQQVNRFAESLAYVSAPISLAKANIEVKEIQHDIEMADRMGDSLSKVYETSGEIWIDVKKILATFAEPLIDTLAVVLPVFKYLSSFLVDFMNNSNEGFTALSMITNSLLAMGGITGIGISLVRLYRAYKQEEENHKSLEVVKQTFAELINSERPMPNIKTMPSGIGV